MGVVSSRRGSRAQVLGGLLGAWTISARERSDRAGGYGREESPSHDRDFLKIGIVNMCFKYGKDMF